MPAWNRRWLSGCSALLLLALLAQVGNSVIAAEQHPDRDSGQCRIIVRSFLMREPLVHRSDLRITALLNAGHYRRASSALRGAITKYGDSWSALTLGNLYAGGLGVPRSASSAFHWYLWSAERGNLFAQRDVANAYLNGEGTPRDTRRAAYWFRLGIAPRQLALSYYDLARTYARGHLAPVDIAKSEYYLAKDLAELRQLVRTPNAMASYYLGMAYTYGDGVRRDRARATQYLCRAAALHYAPAIAALRPPRGQSR
jgi:TPR repeat protein